MNKNERDSISKYDSIAQSLQKRAMIFLEDGDFEQAEHCINQVLDSDPECAPAYLGKLMTVYQVRREEELAGIFMHFNPSGEYLAANGDFQKAIRFGDAALKSRLEGYERAISDRAKQAFGLLTEISEKTRIEWQLLYIDAAKKRALVITKDCIRQMPYHEPGGSTTWADCTLRSWLYWEFFNKNLPASIQTRVINLPLPYPCKGSGQGGTTTEDEVFLLSVNEDKVFLLSVNEANRYFPDDGSRKAKFEGQYEWWWLRSPGSNGDYAAFVNYNGNVIDSGVHVLDDLGVRPALWLSLE